MKSLMKKYNKLPKTIDGQINLLIARGLIVENRDELKYYLRNISYYHLSIYFKYFQKDNYFYKNICFSDILRIYKFDNKLRFLLLELLERIEKSFKCRLINEISVECGDAHWYLDQNFFINIDEHKNILKIINDEIEKNHDDCILHYRKIYNYPKLPPIWNIVELLSFGQCVKICRALKREYKNKIARTFGEDEQFIIGWMHCLSLLRNNCAHHSRLWNRTFNFKPNKSHIKYKKYYSLNTSSRLYDYLVVLQIILSEVNPTSSWLTRLKKYVLEYKINIRSMDFPKDWDSRLSEIILIKNK